ncbi:unnamed protein product [Lupinus luteus]|uniref:Pectinesterase inhibitor domain-containing protein n=1 Tax=Lupinus luteus TaxID=3873 RepID=A0AAV1WQA1_LUPLU
MEFTKSLILIVSISSLLLPINAVRTTSYNALTPEASGPGRLIGIGVIPEVNLFCKDTENPILCAETIVPYFEGEFNPIVVLHSEFEATLNQSLKVANIIAQLQVPMEAIDAVDICKKQYEYIVDTIKEADELLNISNVVDAYYKFASVLAYRSACEDAFVESNGVMNPFAEDSFIVYQLGGNCLAILDGIINSNYRF